MSERPITSLFAAICEWAGARGVKGPGVIDFAGPQGLTCRLNATGEEHENQPPFSVKIEANGWPVCVIGPFGGAVVGITHWTEETLIAAFSEPEVAA